MPVSAMGACAFFPSRSLPAVEPSSADAAVDADEPAGFRVAHPKIHKRKVFLPLTDQRLAGVVPPFLPNFEVHGTP